ncbi:MAG: single-stranded DNA-binding protein [Lactimicrobium sp.]|jgi:single-strand DNA-binding protein|uniref:single-stranded DNA-binding protein n=1 Tax=Lactimicrobium sp. TaxID=2563780 RepID=UPI002F35ED4B
MINRVVLVGRLTKDVEVRKTTSGLSVAQFTVAVDRRMSRDNNGQQSADFISCVAWRQSADFLGSYARKGNLIGVEGRIQTRNYDDKDGKKVYVTEVVCDNVQLLESRKSREAAGSYQQNSAPSYGGYNNSYSNNAQPSYNEPAKQNDSAAGDDFKNGDSLVISSDDLPF